MLFVRSLLSMVIVTTVAVVEVEGQTTPKVNATIYYQSLCGGCTALIRGQFSPYWVSLQYYLNLRLVPCGNAVYHEKNNSVSCPNGPDECAMNTMVACAFKHFSLNDAVAFAVCLQGTSPRNQAFCTTGLPENVTALTTCASGKEGFDLLKANVIETSEVTKQHPGLPKVNLNGRFHIGQKTRFGPLVCKLLPAAVRQRTCNWFQLKANAAQPALSASFTALLVPVVVTGLKVASTLG